MKAKPISIRLSKEPREALKRLSDELHLPQSTIIDLILKAGCELLESAKDRVTLPLKFELSENQTFVKNDNLPKIASLLQMHEQHPNYTNKNADRREFLKFLEHNDFKLTDSISKLTPPRGTSYVKDYVDEVKLSPTKQKNIQNFFKKDLTEAYVKGGVHDAYLSDFHRFTPETTSKVQPDWDVKKHKLIRQLNEKLMDDERLLQERKLFILFGLFRLKYGEVCDLKLSDIKEEPPGIYADEGKFKDIIDVETAQKNYFIYLDTKVDGKIRRFNQIVKDILTEDVGDGGRLVKKSDHFIKQVWHRRFLKEHGIKNNRELEDLFAQSLVNCRNVEFFGACIQDDAPLVLRRRFEKISKLKRRGTSRWIEMYLPEF
jgi:hypothetical protein